MGIAIFAAARMAQAVPAWIDLHWPQRSRAAGALHRRPAAQPASPPASHAAPHAAPNQAAHIAHQWLSRLTRLARHAARPATEPGPQRNFGTRPLRVLRVVEPHQSSGAAGRMVISGRMADVCAELDRLAAAEAAATPRR